MFAAVEVQGAGDLIGVLAARGGLDDRQLRDALKRTRQAYIGADLSAPRGQGFNLVALGDFSPAALELRLSFDRLWRPRVLGEREAEVTALPSAAGCGAGRGEPHPKPAPWLPERTFWEHPGSRLQLACPRPGVLLLSDQSAAALLLRFRGSSPGVLLPPDAQADLERAALFLFFPELPAGDATAGLSRLPIRSVWLAGQVAGAEYPISAVFSLEAGVNQAAVERLFRLLIPLLLRRAQVSDPVGKFKALSLTVTSTRVRIDNLRLASDELSRFLADFVRSDFVRSEGSPDAGSR